MAVMDLPVMSIAQTVFELESGNGNFDGQTDEQTDGITPFSKGT